MRIPLVTVALLAVASRALAQVPCDDPDNLCTGDPCVIGTIAVVTPCEVDFGDRSLEIAGTISVPDGGLMSFTAATITLTGEIDGRHVGDGGSGALVLLTADTGSATMEGPIDVSGAVAGGGVLVDGATGVMLDGILANGKFGPGGLVTALSAGGSVIARRRIEARGRSGGTIRFEGPVPSAVPIGNVSAQNVLDARGSAGNGGTVSITGQNVFLGKLTDVRGKGGDGGTLHAFASERLETTMKVLASGSGNGGAIELLLPPASTSAASVILIFGKLTARGQTGNGGSLTATSDGAVIGLQANVDLRGGANGGSLVIDADRFFAARARVTVTGVTSGGTVRMNQSGSDAATIDGKFDARPSGSIAASAPAANMTVDGLFRAGPAGCVGFSAGGALDTAGARSDVPLAASCP